MARQAQYKNILDKNITFGTPLPTANNRAFTTSNCIVVPKIQNMYFGSEQRPPDGDVPAERLVRPASLPPEGDGTFATKCYI